MNGLYLILTGLGVIGFIYWYVINCIEPFKIKVNVYKTINGGVWGDEDILDYSYYQEDIN